MHPTIASIHFILETCEHRVTFKLEMSNALSMETSSTIIAILDI